MRAAIACATSSPNTLAVRRAMIISREGRKRLAGTLSDGEKDQCIEDARPMMEIPDIIPRLSNLRLQ
jgi:hypothetical protein